MGIAKYIKEIGRGQAGARPLEVGAAEDLMGQILDGTVSDLEVGAFALAMRVKGETLDELQGFLAALQTRLTPIRSDRPVVVIASYNGARRLPNLTPLLALRLAQEGLRVLVHGPRSDPTRVTSAEIFTSLGLRPADDTAAVTERWRRQEPAFVPTEALCPALQRLLDVRWVVGLRNSGHTIAKMLQPVAGAPTLRLMSYTHPEFGTLMAQFAERSGQALMLLRGTEGEAVADARRQPKLEVWLDGRPRPDLGCAPQDGVLTELPLLPASHDAATTALYIQSVISGEKPVPTPVERQVQAICDTVQALSRGMPAQQSA